MQNIILNNWVKMWANSDVPIEDSTQEILRIYNLLDNVDFRTILDLYMYGIYYNNVRFDSELCGEKLKEIINSIPNTITRYFFTVGFLQDKDLQKQIEKAEKMETGTFEESKSTFYTICITALTAKLWEAFKSVYKIDTTFATHFSDSTSLKLNLQDLFYLPVNSFYVDLSAIFTDQIKLYGVSIDIVTNYVDNKFSSFDIFLTYFFADRNLATEVISIELSKCTNDNGIYVYEFENQTNNLFLEKLYDDELPNSIKDTDYIETYLNTLSKVNIIVLNLITYMVSKKPDIQLSKLTKKRQERATRLGKTYTELLEYEVGYRYGKAISLYSDRVEREYTEHRQLDGDRKSPRPHLVKAHWHGYWCGKGKTDWELRWVAPYYQGYGEIDCVIHDCIEIDKTKYSKGEEMLYFLLTVKGISFEKQYYIADIGRYFDACVYINGKEIFVEYDGAQHFRTVKNWDFEKTVASDIEKNAYCKEHNIPLLRIRYDQDLYMSDILDTLSDNYTDYLARLNPYFSNDEYYAIRKERL